MINLCVILKTVSWGSVSSACWTDVFPGRTGEKHVSGFVCLYKFSFVRNSTNSRFVMCFRYGTGCFLLRNTGAKVQYFKIVF